MYLVHTLNKPHSSSIISFKFTEFTVLMAKATRLKAITTFILLKEKKENSNKNIGDYVFI